MKSKINHVNIDLQIEHPENCIYVIRVDYDNICNRIAEITETNGRELPPFIRKEAEQLALKAVAHLQGVKVLVSIKGGTFYEAWANQPSVELHKIDIDRHGIDPVMHQIEQVEYSDNLDPKEVFNSYWSEYGHKKPTTE